MRSPASDEEAQHVAPALQPADEQEYVVVLGRSLTGGDVAAEGGETAAAREQQHDNDVFASFGYEFQPASVDKSTPGLVGVDGSSGVQVLMGSSTGAAGGVSFKGKVVENKDTDCLLIFDGSGFRLERCPFSCMQLRHVRATPARRRVKIQQPGAACGNAAEAANASSSSGTAIKPMKRIPVAGRRPVGRPKGSTAKPKEMIAATGKRPVGRPKGSTNASKKARSTATRY